MTIFNRLLEEHKKIAENMEDIVLVLTSPVFPEVNQSLVKLFPTFYRTLFAHHLAENEILYPRLTTFHFLESRILRAQQFHEVIQNILYQLKISLEKITANKQSKEIAIWRAKFMLLRDIIFLHLKEEKSEIFPVAEELLTPVEKETLLEAYNNKLTIINCMNENSLNFIMPLSHYF